MSSQSIVYSSEMELKPWIYASCQKESAQVEVSGETRQTGKECELQKRRAKEVEGIWKEYWN